MSLGICKRCGAEPSAICVKCAGEIIDDPVRDAAPDLLEAGKELLTALKGTYLDDLHRAEEHMENAIAKAEGRPADKAEEVKG